MRTQNNMINAFGSRPSPTIAHSSLDDQNTRFSLSIARVSLIATPKAFTGGRALGTFQREALHQE
jgi:hypothetical protein